MYTYEISSLSAAQYSTEHPKILTVAWFQAAELLRSNPHWQQWASRHPVRLLGYLPDWAVHDPTQPVSKRAWKLAWKLWRVHAGRVRLIVRPVAGSYRLSVAADLVALTQQARTTLKTASGARYAWGSVEVSQQASSYAVSLDGHDIKVTTHGTGAHVGGVVWADADLPASTWSVEAHSPLDVARWIQYHLKGYDARTNAQRIKARDGRVVVIPPDPVELAAAVADGFSVRAALAALGRRDMPRVTFDVHRRINTELTENSPKVAVSVSEPLPDRREGLSDESCGSLVYAPAEDDSPRPRS